MPVVGAPATVGRIEFEDGGAAGVNRICRVGSKIAEARRETLLAGVVQMSLAAKEDHLVFCKSRLDRRDGSIRQIAG
jgi:hypothetical protein